MSEIIINLVFLIFSILTIIIVIKKLFENRLFNIDSTNPYRRFCTKCGQKQELHQYTISFKTAWWEDMGYIYNKD